MRLYGLLEMVLKRLEPLIYGFNKRRKIFS